ncbi:outer membrane protein assembly factor BamD [Saccharospirillum mangrovi]|uniref:outer membrane protein assembly factor BamD n=1 Tax=Saccharospirillum mangrovi TaxID=2161747 RepID=UPI00130052A8|nr:outer membrane protein assembly factor BamD [Saccharospirillum mangrovi]
MPSLFTKPLSLFTLVILLIGLNGCALFRNNDAESEQALYERASDYIESQSFDLAIDTLEQLQNRFPFGRYAQQTQLDLMYARYRSRDFAQAVLDADRFTRLNPDYASVDYAWYLKGMSYYRLYEQNAGITGRGDLAQRSQQDGERAFSALKDYTDRFPTSDYREDAIDTMILLKDALARHELVVADYYMRRGAWIAAAERAKVVQSHYPGVSAQGDALVVLIESYDALGRDEDRALALADLQEQYPDHPTLSSGHYRTPYIEKERWWVKLLTLGWFS